MQIKGGSELSFQFKINFDNQIKSKRKVYLKTASDKMAYSLIEFSKEGN